MRVEFSVPIAQAANFRDRLLSFLSANGSDSEAALTIYHAEPAGNFVRERVYFEDPDLAVAFCAYWRSVRF